MFVKGAKVDFYLRKVMHIVLDSVKLSYKVQEQTGKGVYRKSVLRWVGKFCLEFGNWLFRSFSYQHGNFIKIMIKKVFFSNSFKFEHAELLFVFF